MQDTSNSNQRDQIMNIQPRTRSEREALRDKDRIEKTRVNNRVGFEAKNMDARLLIHQAPPDSTLYIAENERFDKDFAVADKRRREKDWDLQERIKEKKRLEGLDREAFKWKRLEDQEKRVISESIEICLFRKPTSRTIILSNSRMERET